MYQTHCFCGNSSSWKWQIDEKSKQKIFSDATTRHLYYLQLKENFLSINHNLRPEEYIKLVALSLQADYGNYDPCSHKYAYFDLNQYFPRWVRRFFQLHKKLNT